jgi:hypothetical protein
MNLDTLVNCLLVGVVAIITLMLVKFFVFPLNAMAVVILWAIYIASYSGDEPESW